MSLKRTKPNSNNRRDMMKRLMSLLAFLFFAVVVTIPPLSAADAPAVMVGRVYHIEKDLLRYVPAEKDWVAVVKDAPFSTGDTLYSGNQGMAELIVPNGTWIRIGNSTQVQFIALDADVSEADVGAGVVRFYNKGSSTVIKATSPFGYVLASPGTVFDFYVGENSVEVLVVKGKVSFIHTATNAKYEASAGSPSVLADQGQVASGEGTIDPNWDGWNAARENFWASKVRVKGRSVEYLPPSLRDDAYALEENGRWEKVPYEGSDRWFWRPTVVAAGWAPFSVGRWTEWYGDQTWIPAEPFGYVTHHYGNWVNVSSNWYWAPPVVAAVAVGAPLINVGFAWYPGRVSWIHSGAYVGWVPLAPTEVYYSHHHWGGPHTMVVNNVNITQINISPRNYAYVNHAVLVNQNNFYRVNNYRDVRVTNINNTTIINNYRSAPVVNNTVINNYSSNRQRFNYSDVKVNEKPHRSVVDRIQQNDKVIHQGKRENAKGLEQQVKGIREGKASRDARIQQPKTTNYIVPANEVNRPKSDLKLPQRELKGPGKGAQTQQGVPGKPGVQTSQPGSKPEGVGPAKPGSKPEGIGPAKTGPISPKPEGVGPAKPGHKPEGVGPAKPGSKPEGIGPAKTGPISPKPEGVGPAKPGSKPEGVAPAKIGQKPERVAPEKPAHKPEGTAPTKTTPKVEHSTPAKAVPKPEHTTPAKANPKVEGNAPAKTAPAKTAPTKTAPAKAQPQGQQEQQEKPR
jgi:hypothetical protein